MAELQCPGCGSSQVEKLTLFVAKVTADRMRPEWVEPSVPTLSRGGPLLCLAVGVAVLVSGVVLSGILVALAGAVWLSRVNGTIREAEAEREGYSKKRICLNCETILPPA